MVREREDAALGRGREQLEQAGIARATADPTALLPLAGRSLELDLAIVERLATEPSDANAAALVEIASGAEHRGWKSVVKESRRALYRFTQRGVAAPVASAPADTSSVVRRLAAPTLEGFLSPIDGRGDRLVWLVRSQREGGLLVLTAIVNEPGGLRDVAIAELPRKTLRRMERDLQSRHGLRMIGADGPYCDALVAEAFARARAAGTPGVGEYPTFRARLTTADPEPRDPPLFARVADADAARLDEASRRAAALLEQPEFASWLLERTTLEPYLGEIAAARDSPLLLSRPQQQERIQSIITRALRELFGGDGGTAYRRRLEEMAYYLHASGRRDLALAAAGTAHALATSTLGGEGVPFFEELARRSFGAFFSEDIKRAQEEAESSVLVRPGAAAGAKRPLPPRLR